MNSQYNVKDVNGRINISAEGDVTLSGNVVYWATPGAREGETLSVDLFDTTSGETYWIDPNGERQDFTESLNVLIEPTFLKSARDHGHLGKDSKGYLYGKVDACVRSTVGVIAFYAKYLPSTKGWYVLGSRRGSVNRAFFLDDDA
jgi:hypothetical protein